MNSDQKKEHTSLIRPEKREITMRSANLVRRGLSSLSKRSPRRVQFPNGYGFGKLYTVDGKNDYWWDKRNWIALGPAEGEVIVPPGHKLMINPSNVYDLNNDWYLHYFEVFEALKRLASACTDEFQGIDLEVIFREESISDQNLKVIGIFKSLEWLDLSSLELYEISFIQNLLRLKWLDVSNNPVCSLAPLQQMVDLFSLNLSSTEIIDIEYLEDLLNLVELDLSSTSITEIGYLKNLKKLRRLNLDDTPYCESEIKRLQQALPNCAIYY